MQPHLAAAFLFFAFVLLAILRWRSAMPIAESAEPAAWPGSDEGDEEQRPGTERTERRLWPVGLSAAVAVTAALRVALLVTLHA